MANDVNGLKRQLSPDMSQYLGSAKIVLTGAQLQRDIRSWLSPPDPRKNYNTACGSRHKETGLWFVDSKTFSEWRACGSGSFLWINGKRQLSLGAYICLDTDSLPLCSGRWEKRPLVSNINPSVFHLGDLPCRPVLRLSKTLRECGILGTHHSLCISTTSGTI